MPTKATASPRAEKGMRKHKAALGKRGWIFILIGWIVSSLMLIGIDQARLIISREKALKYKEGELVSEDLFLDYDFEFIDDVATSRVLAMNRSLVPTVFTVRNEITDEVLGKFDRFSSFLEPSVSNRLSEEALSSLSREFPRVAALINREFSRDEKEIDHLLRITHSALQTLLIGGIFHFDPSETTSASGVIEVVYSDSLTEKRVPLIRDSLTTPENLAEKTRELTELSGLNADDLEFVTALVSYFAEPNAYRNTELSEKNRKIAEEATEAIRISLVAGTRLLTAGTVVTAQQARILRALRDRSNVGFHNFIDPLLFMAFLCILGIISAHALDIRLGSAKAKQFSIVLGSSYLLLAALIITFVRFPGHITVSTVMPTALFTLLLAQLLQDRRLALLSSIFMAFLIFFMSNRSALDLLITLTAGIGGSLAVGYRESRIGLLKAGPRLAFILAFGTLITGILIRLPFKALMNMSLLLAANGLITGILSLAFLPLLEHVLNTATTFRLLELSDQNVAILKRMRLRAPGTYIHSQNVAHLSEAACDAIGADGLLARVGAYYHDVGKIDQAQFFVENQTGENKHDELKASLSAAVIKSHVKIGLEKGRELRLPDEVLAVIEQHHGTSIIRYFYDRAQKEKKVANTSPEDFSYSGPRPLSREAAVVMLADNAEAATRTLKKPTVAKLEKFVWDLIMDRFRAGELNDCDLTLRDLEIVKDTFVHVLTGHFHNRIEYPKENGKEE